MTTLVFKGSNGLWDMLSEAEALEAGWTSQEIADCKSFDSEGEAEDEVSWLNVHAITPEAKQLRDSWRD
jgi:hypothetical protein